MMRLVNLNIILAILAIGIAFATYHVKDEAARAAKTLAHVNAKIADEEVRLRALDAEWSYLNQPSRLQQLASRHLSLAQIKANQVLDVAEMPERFPFEVGARRDPNAAPALRAPAPAPEPGIAPAVTPARAQALAALYPQD